MIGSAIEKPVIPENLQLPPASPPPPPPLAMFALRSASARASSPLARSFASSTAYENILTEVRGKVGIITLNRPKVRLRTSALDGSTVGMLCSGR